LTKEQFHNLSITPEAEMVETSRVLKKEVIDMADHIDIL